MFTCLEGLCYAPSTVLLQEAQSRQNYNQDQVLYSCYWWVKSVLSHFHILLKTKTLIVCHFRFSSSSSDVINLTALQGMQWSIIGDRALFLYICQQTSSFEAVYLLFKRMCKAQQLNAWNFKDSWLNLCVLTKTEICRCRLFCLKNIRLHTPDFVS